MVAVAGCISSADSGDEDDDGGSEEELENTITDAEYDGTHEDHDGTEFELLEYGQGQTCQKLMRISVEDDADLDSKYLEIFFYANDEQVGSTHELFNSHEEDDFERVNFSYCELSEYNRFKIAVLDGS